MSTFQAVLLHLGELHRQEVDQARRESEQQIVQLTRENSSLRDRLAGKEEISPGDIHFESIKDNDGEAGPINDLGDWDQAAATRIYEHEETDAALVPFVMRTSSTLERENITSHVPGDFTLKDAWNKSIETTHWGANFDAYMFGKNPWRAISDNFKGVLRRKGDTRHEVAPSSSAIAARSVDDVELDELGEPLVETGCNPSCTIYPNSSARLSWDLAGLVLIAYDLIMIPFTLAYEPANFWLLVGMDWITLLFWTGDMIQGFFLGYFEKGLYVSDNRKILRHYMMTWFIPDAVVVGPDWFVSVAALAAKTTSEDGQASEMFKFLKGARAFRVLRLLRLLKLQRIINMLYDMIESEHTFICVNLAKLLLAVLVLNHVIACIWFLIGRACMEGGMRNWITVGDLEHEGISYKYSTSLHWSLTQFTPASMDVSARNVPERCFSILVLFFSVVAFSSIIASITGAMTSLRNMKAEEMKQIWLLRRYLRQREVTSDLGDRIFKYLAHHSAKSSKLVQTNSLKATLNKLSLALQSELTHQLNYPFLIRHPFFQYLDDSMSVVMHRLCHVCLSSQSHAEKEVIFNPGDKASGMLFIKGRNTLLEYTTVDGLRLDPPPRQEDWVTEAVLWTAWRHAGRLQSVSAADLIAVDPTQFVEVMCIHPRSWFYAKRYAAKFVAFLNSLAPCDIIDILRDPEWYTEAVKSCDTYDIDDNGEPASESGRSGNTSGEVGKPVDGGAKEEASQPTGSPAARQRWFQICPWAASSACEPWCSPNPHQR
uniref:Ion transport domain-containing protein n=1 Tax=Alexandrium monilatum TaxID=311494 RepID=A0A7S4T5B9_9DINO